MAKVVRPVRRVIVAGGRDFADKDRLWYVLNAVLSATDVVVSGVAKGADSLALEYARKRGLAVEEFPADWQGQGKAAGVIRNQAMAWKADVLIAFWDGKSRGTKDMIERACRAKLEIHLYFY